MRKRRRTQRKWRKGREVMMKREIYWRILIRLLRVVKGKC